MVNRESQVRYTVPYADTDQMSVVYYANYLVYFERARTFALRQLGYPYSQMEKDGFLLPIGEAHVNYLKFGRYEDELTLCCRFELLSPVRVKAHCRVLREDEVLAEGYTIHACFSAEKQRPVRFPEALLAQLSTDGAGGS